MSGPYTTMDVRATYKERDAWWTVALVDPLAGRLVLWIANRTSVTPTQLTSISGLFGLSAAGAFLQGSRLSLIIGAALFYLSFLADCMDGKLARLKDAGSLFGAWFDYISDRFKVAACALGLMTGQFLLTDRSIYLFLAFLVLFAEMFRQLHAAHIRQMHGLTPTRSGVAVQNGAGGLLGREGQGRLYSRMRSAALARRIRAHAWSGIEFEMFVFIIGPLTGAVLEVTVAATAMLTAFEIGIIMKLYRSTRQLDKALLPATSANPAPESIASPELNAPSRS